MGDTAGFVRTALPGKLRLLIKSLALRSRQGFSVEHIKLRIPISTDIWWRRSKTLSPRVAQLSQMAVQGQPTWVRCFRRVKSGKMGGPTWTQQQVRFAFSVRTTESHVWPSLASREGGLYRFVLFYTWYDSQDFFAKSARQLGFEPVRRHKSSAHSIKIRRRRSRSARQEFFVSRASDVTTCHDCLAMLATDLPPEFPESADPASLPF